MPRSQKVRALLALLALERRPVDRSRACDLLWDAANDPRGELRWCLSKLRRLVDTPSLRRVVASGSGVALDCSDCVVDAHELERLADAGFANAPTDALERTLALADGGFAEGLTVDGPELAGWLVAQRERFRLLRAELLGELARRAPGPREALGHLEAWLRVAPLELGAHALMARTLAQAGRAQDASAHLCATRASFLDAGLDTGPLDELARGLREPATGPTGAATEAPRPVDATPATRRPGSVVVLPFLETTPESSAIARGLTDDLIERLARLRVLFVIARGTAYALGGRSHDVREVGRLLDVAWAVSGAVRREGERVTLQVELAATRDAGILWAERAEARLDGTHGPIDAMVDRVVAAVAQQIERAESRRAVLKAPGTLDGWEAYHRGLWHMYRFTGADNARAERCFRRAIELDPTFSRAHAGLSFTHFQNVFLDLTPDRDHQLALALTAARTSVGADDRDPAAHWALGRALWLRGDHDDSLGELERSVELSPNFALGLYTLGFVHAQAGDPSAALEATRQSFALSPFDPLAFGMLASRALAHMRLGEQEEAAAWAVKATNRPNAHSHILAIAATNLALAGRREAGRAFAARSRTLRAGYTVEDLLRAFRFEPEAKALLRAGARRIGFD